jgi:hypothetical protein
MEAMKWMQVAFDENRQPTSGSIEYDGYGVKMFKNCLYLLDKQAWSRKCGYGKPFVGEIKIGETQYKHLKIIKAHGPGTGFYAAVQVTDYGLLTPKSSLMVGASVYNRASGDAVGLTAQQVDFLVEFLRMLTAEGRLLLNPGYLEHFKETTNRLK